MRGLLRLASAHVDLACASLLVLLPVAWFNRVLVPSLSGKTLLPFDNLYTFEPWRSLRPDVVPYNPLISDLVLQNVPWVLHIRRALATGELPLWNPDLFSGVAFLAGGQGGVLYPPSVLLYTLPLPEAFGWFIALHISLAGLGMFAFGSTLGLRKPAAVLAAVAFMFGGYFITNATFPQAIATAAWTPPLLAITERLLQRAEKTSAQSLWLWLCGALCVGLQLLASHVETAFYGLVVVGAYAAVRLCVMATRHQTPRILRTGVSLLGLVVLGTGLAAALLVPMLDALSGSARIGARSAEDLAELAWPLPQLWTLLLPDLFGNPTHHHWLDLAHLTFRSTPSNEPIVWGTKNYVEGGQYLGVLTLLLAVVGIRYGLRLLATIFGGIALVALLLVLGSPLYLLLEAVPGADQLRSPFRWVFPFSLAMSLLAGLGLDALLRLQHAVTRSINNWLVPSVATAGALVLGSVVLSLISPDPFLKLSQRLVTDPAWAQRIFGNAGLLIPGALQTPQMFWGYESLGLIRLGLMALASAAVLVLLVWRPPLGISLSIGALLVDLYSVHGGFLPASDVNLSPLVSRPPLVDAIEARETAGQPWRFTTFELGDEKTFLANAGMYYAWQDVRGYDSIVPRQYATFVQRLGLPSDSLNFNRIAPTYNRDVLDNILLALLNVRYVLTEQRIDSPSFRQVYRDERIAAYENATALPRTFVAPAARVLPIDQQPLEHTDPRDVVYLDVDPGVPLDDSGRGASRVVEYGMNGVEVSATVDGPAWVVLADAYAPGWHATATSSDGQSESLEVQRAYATLRAVRLPAAGTWKVRFQYLPDSLRVGVALSLASALVLVGVAFAGLVAMSRKMAWGTGRSGPSPQLRAPYSPAGHEA